jgi:hypothetical protein
MHEAAVQQEVTMCKHKQLLLSQRALGEATAWAVCLPSYIITLPVAASW